MGYTVKMVAEKTNISPHVLRYYEKEGLLPHVKRTAGGIRHYSEVDLEWLSLIDQLWTQVKFGKKSTKRKSSPEEITFYLLHLSLMREYLELEFKELEDDKRMTFPYNIENIIDDWVCYYYVLSLLYSYFLYLFRYLWAFWLVMTSFQIYPTYISQMVHCLFCTKHI